MIKRLVLAIAVSLLSQVALGVQPDEIMSDPTLEARARAISTDLRCLVCQNQSIDDSAAPLARDLRLLVREQLATGHTDQEVVDYLVKRYGEFVLLKPRFEWHTAILWLTPLGVLLLGAIGLIVQSRRRALNLGIDDSELSPSEKERIAQLDIPPQSH